MNQMTRTLAFVIAASAAVIGAVFAHILTKPQVATDQAHSLIGQQFFPNFVDPMTATAIRVAAWNPTTSKVEEFEVRYQNGQWRIPSHNNYPADGKEQLAKAAASAVGIVRGSLSAEGADTSTLERLGVVDPLDDTTTQGVGMTGTRITLYQGDEVVADYIIGRKFGDVAPTADDDNPADDDTAGKQSKEGRFYVRRPDEKLVYLADVKIDVSTKFRDWIDKNLLEMTQGDLRQITVNRYSIDEEQGKRIAGDRSELTRNTAGDPWKLAGLDETKEKLKAGVVSAMAKALDELQIVGVRKKPEALVKLFTDGQIDVLQALTAQADLQRHGFFLTSQDLLSNEGEVFAGTQEGVQYVLRFGEVFTGSDLDIEIGQAESAAVATPTDAAAKDAAAPAAETKPEAASDPAASADANKPAEGEQPAGSTAKRSRYVIVEAMFDPSLLGPEPVAPVKPTAPNEAAPPAPAAGNTPAAAAPMSSEAAPPAASTPAAPAAETPAAPATPAPEGTSNCDDPAPAEAPASPAAVEAPAATPAADPATPAADPAAAPAAAPMADPAGAPAVGPAAERPKTPQDIYQEALKQYEQDLERYTEQQQDYNQRLADGKKRVDALNKRFAEWYYVISADVYEDLRVSREQLVEPLEPPMVEAATPEATSPDANAAPAATPEASPATPPTASPAQPESASPATPTPPPTDGAAPPATPPM